MIARWEDVGDEPDAMVHRLKPEVHVLDLFSLPARLWVQKNVPAPREWWCGSLVYVGDVVELVERMTDGGLYVI